MTAAQHTCPRRFGPSAAGPDAWAPDGTCTYCGSVSGDIFMARLESGNVTLEPTDKNYKVYVNNKGGPSIGQKFYFMHLTEAQKRRFVELFNEGRLIFEGGNAFYRLPFFMGYPEP